MLKKAVADLDQFHMYSRNVKGKKWREVGEYFQAQDYVNAAARVVEGIILAEKIFDAHSTFVGGSDFFNPRVFAAGYQIVCFFPSKYPPDLVTAAYNMIAHFEAIARMVREDRFEFEHAWDFSARLRNYMRLCRQFIESNTGTLLDMVEDFDTYSISINLYLGGHEADGLICDI
jgi:hypothetical protein